MKCDIKRCRQPVNVVYLGKNVCDKHWHHYRAENQSCNALRQALNIVEQCPCGT